MERLSQVDLRAIAKVVIEQAGGALRTYPYGAWSFLSVGMMCGLAIACLVYVVLEDEPQPAMTEEQLEAIIESEVRARGGGGGGDYAAAEEDVAFGAFAKAVGLSEGHRAALAVEEMELALLWRLDAVTLEREVRGRALLTLAR